MTQKFTEKEFIEILELLNKIKFNEDEFEKYKTIIRDLDTFFWLKEFNLKCNKILFDDVETKKQHEKLWLKLISFIDYDFLIQKQNNIKEFVKLYKNKKILNKYNPKKIDCFFNYLKVISKMSFDDFVESNDIIVGKTIKEIGNKYYNFNEINDFIWTIRNQYNSTLICDLKEIIDNIKKEFCWAEKDCIDEESKNKIRNYLINLEKTPKKDVIVNFIESAYKNMCNHNSYIDDCDETYRLFYLKKDLIDSLKEKVQNNKITKKDAEREIVVFKIIELSYCDYNVLFKGEFYNFD